MSPFAQRLRAMIATQKHNGLPAAELHMHPTTHAMFVRDAALQPQVPPDNRSLLDKMRAPRKAPGEPTYVFDDVRVVANERLPLGGALLRGVHLMGSENWLDAVLPDLVAMMGQTNMQMEKMPTGNLPWGQKIEAAADSTPNADEGALAMLSRSGGLTPENVLIKAMERVDRVKDIVVVRYLQDGGIDMCSTFDRYGIIGGLQAALQYVHQRD